MIFTRVHLQKVLGRSPDRRNNDLAVFAAGGHDRNEVFLYWSLGPRQVLFRIRFFAQILIKALPAMKSLTTKHFAPFIGKITKSGSVSILHFSE